MTDSKIASDVGLIESLSKVFALLLAILYLVGFLVVAIYLTRYGVSSFSVLHLQYLIAGIWLLGPPVLHACVMLTGRRFEQRAAPEVRGEFNWRRILISALLTGLPYALLVLLLGTIPEIAAGMTWGIFYRLSLFYVGMVICAQVFWASWQAEAHKDTWLLNRNHAAPFYLVSLLIIVIWYAAWFAVRIYPIIPFSLGGGKPLTVAFIEGEKKLPDELQKVDRAAKRSIPYKLLVSTDKYYVVVSPTAKERSIEISRDAVAGMIVLE